MLALDTGHGSRVTDDLHAARVKIDLCRLGLIEVIAAVMHRVGESLTNCSHGIADPTTGLGTACLLLQVHYREVSQIAQATPKLVQQRSPEDAFFLHVSRAIRRELHDLDLRPANPLRGLLRKEEQTNVPRHILTVHFRRQSHAPVGSPIVRFVEQSAPNIAQVLAHKGAA